jgi:transglutaminase superfamily protein
MLLLKNFLFSKFIFRSIAIIVFIYLSTYNTDASHQKTARYSKKEIKYYNISESKGFTMDVVVFGTQLEGKSTTIDIPFSELEKFIVLEAEYSSAKGKFKSVKDFTTRSLTSSSFYTGYQSKSFVMKAADFDYPFNYHYSITNSNLAFLSKLNLADYDLTDTIIYSIQVPKKFKLIMKIDGDTSLLKTLTIDKTVGEALTTWTIISIAKEFYDYETQDGFYFEPSTTPPRMRLALIPSTYANDGYAFMNSWYCELLEPVSKLSQESIGTIENWVKSKTDINIIQTIYDSVRNKISYISFENGIGAIQPRDVNTVLKNKHGDCKDMANLMRLAIQHFDIEAWVAISSTLSIPYDLDFPCLASANHAICVVKTDSKYYFLDATEQFGIFGYPSRHIQGKKVLLVNEDGYEVLDVPIVPKNKNKTEATFDLTLTDKSIEGTFSYIMHGHSKIDFTTLIGSKSERDYNRVLSKYLTSLFKNLTVENLNTISTDSTLIIRGSVKADNIVILIDSVNYLSQNILMYPHPFPDEVHKNNRIIFYETQLRSFTYNIRVPSMISLNTINPMHKSEEGISFDYSVSTKEKNTIQIKYTFQNNNVSLDSPQIDSYNKINKLINQTFSKKILYE